MKNEYIWLNFIRYDDWTYWVEQTSLLILACLLTYAAISLLPKYVTNPAYRLSRGFELEKQKLKGAFERDLSAMKRKAASDDLAAAGDKIEADEKAQTLQVTKENRWEEDFIELSSLPFSKDFKFIVESVYEHNGRIRGRQSTGDGGFSIPTQILAYADSNGIVELDDEAKTIRLTEKGKYFIALYQAEMF